MTTQIINAFFHIFFSFYFHDFSPGTITALLLYLPVNYLIFKAALREGHLESTKQMMAPVLTAGKTSGSVTFTKRCQGLHPRFSAASSKDLLTAFKAVCVIRKMNGKNFNEKTRMIPWAP